MKMTGAQIICESLEKEGVEVMLAGDIPQITKIVLREAC